MGCAQQSHGWCMCLDTLQRKAWLGSFVSDPMYQLPSARSCACSLDKGYCVGGACADLSRTPQALAPAINNGSTAALPNKLGRGWH